MLGLGDAFHLIPRTSWTQTSPRPRRQEVRHHGRFLCPYVLYLTRFYEGAEKKLFTAAIWVLAAARIVLCHFPQTG